jgi:acyl carrier protein
MLETKPRTTEIVEAIRELLGPSQQQMMMTPEGEIDMSIQLLELGLVDSKGLLEMIVEIEHRCGVEFNPDRIDVDKGVTLGALANAFD